MDALSVRAKSLEVVSGATPKPLEFQFLSGSMLDGECTDRDDLGNAASTSFLLEMLERESDGVPLALIVNHKSAI
ncbi:MAG: hypothetical protein WCA22_23415 [Candidatus Binatus sp.]